MILHGIGCLPRGCTRRPVRCVIYTRQSVGSSDELSSCAVQREACAVYAASQGWIVEDYFEDLGFSGATLDRPGLQKLLRVVRHFGTDRILVHRVDRLSRDLRDSVKLLDEFRGLGADLVIVTASELGHAAQDHFLLNIMASFAEFEREMIAARIADARARLKSERRRLAGAVPFGYTADPHTKQLVVQPGEADAVRWIFAEAAAGKRPSEIAAAAIALEYRTKAGGPWTARQVVATLRNPVYVGYFPDGSRVRPGCHQPIIALDLFEAAGRALDSRRTAGPKSLRYGFPWPLRGKILCGRCGRPLTSHSCRRGSKVYRYYRCRATGGGRPPCGHQVQAGAIEFSIARQYRNPEGKPEDLLDSQLRLVVDVAVYDPGKRRISVSWKEASPAAFSGD